MKKLLKNEICESRILFTGPTDVLKRVEKSNNAVTVHEQCMNSSRTISLNACQKKKRENTKLKTLTPDVYPNPT